MSSDLVDCKKSFSYHIPCRTFICMQDKSIKEYGNRLYGLQEIGCLMIHREQ
jgi:hypothetical protein